ncbi:uncharacterized protein LOC118433727 [Folsomia candida]|uniref:uncharacterized protein LOC118433727 n=1 Tax=Folsomia candida TaxID=158441 RepID=UPI0016054F7E|nr:uncharacterized protein LOC118433727 [Folsomia candida]
MLPYFGKLSTTSVPYLDLYVGLNEINVTLHVVMFETSKRPVLEGNEIDTSTSCLSYGPVFHTDLTPTNLLHLAKLCYVRTLTPVGNYGDEGLSDDLYGEIDLADPDELVAKAVDELPRKVGGVLGIRDIINIGIGTHDERYLPFFTLMVDYEDYTGTTQTSKVCLLLSTTLDFLFENELESEIWDCRPLCVYSDVAGFSNFRFDDANDSDLIEDVWNCLRGKMLDDPVGWLEDVKTLESLKRPDVLQENYGDETVPPSSELTINEVQLEWRSCEKGANYLNMVVQVEVFGGQGDDVKRKMSIHAAIIELGVPLKSSDLEYPTCLLMFGEGAHSKLTPPILKNVTKVCYTMTRNNELRGKATSGRSAVMAILTDGGYKISDNIETSISLNDPGNRMNEVLKALRTKPGKVTRVKDLFTLYVPNKVIGEEEPILKYTVDYEDYEGNQYISKTVCLLMSDTMDALLEMGVDAIPFIWECEPLADY